MTGPQLLEVLEPVELVALVEALRRQGKAICAKERFPDHHVVPSERDVEILRLRIVDGATHEAIARAVGLSNERVRQVLGSHFGIYGTSRGAR
jgi:DNA-directed RNA polymerase sigma subunit (sigma70/sigma32)